MTFKFEETVKSFTVYFYDESLYEKTEDFFLDVEIPQDTVLKRAFKGSPAKIEIANDDSNNCIMNYISTNTAVLIGKL